MGTCSSTQDLPPDQNLTNQRLQERLKELEFEVERLRKREPGEKPSEKKPKPPAPDFEVPANVLPNQTHPRSPDRAAEIDWETKELRKIQEERSFLALQLKAEREDLSKLRKAREAEVSNTAQPVKSNASSPDVENVRHGLKMKELEVEKKKAEMEKQAREMRGLFTRLKTKLKTQELALVKKEETLVETETNNARLKAMSQTTMAQNNLIHRQHSELVKETALLKSKLSELAQENKKLKAEKAIMEEVSRERQTNGAHGAPVPAAVAAARTGALTRPPSFRTGRKMIFDAPPSSPTEPSDSSVPFSNAASESIESRREPRRNAKQLISVRMRTIHQNPIVGENDQVMAEETGEADVESHQLESSIQPHYHTSHVSSFVSPLHEAGAEYPQPLVTGMASANQRTMSEPLQRVPSVERKRFATRV